MTWLVTGGAGYIGAHVVRALHAAGLGAVVLDDLSTGRAEFVPADVPLVEGSVLDGPVVAGALVGHAVTGVIHLAGYKYAGVSIQRPVHTYEQNVTGTVVLLREMAAAGIRDIVFSSSAAVYGTPTTELVTEATPVAPESPYGRSKLVGEWLVEDEARARGLRGVSLRYFNVVGSGDPAVWDTSPHNLFPLVLEDLAKGRIPRINGADYPTPDGTCVRDYVHVADVAAAHVAAALALGRGDALLPVYNLGTGTGTSVREIMRALAEATGSAFTPEIGPRRAGDPARIVASSAAAERDLRWRAERDLADMARSAAATHPSRRP